MTSALKVLAEYGGIYGIIIFGLAAALIMFWRHLNRLQDKYDKVQEARVVEAKAVITELMEYSKTMGGLSIAVTALKDMITTLKEVILTQRSGS